MFEAIARPTALRGPLGAGLSPARSRTASIVCGELDLGDDLLAHREPVAAAQGVPLADLAGVELQALRELVHLRLVAEHHLHPAEAAEGRGRRVVRVRGGRADPRVLHAVGTARVHRRVEQHQRREVRVRAGVGDDLDVLREDRAVARGGGPVASCGCGGASRGRAATRSRVHCIRTGRRVWATASARYGSTVMSSLPPKPPPTYGAITRTFESGTPRIFATSR